MTGSFKAGDRVRLRDVPDWLIHDLPESERLEILGFRGHVAIVQKVDSAGYVWLGFGTTTEDGDDAYYSGHTFCVSPDCLDRL